MSQIVVYILAEFARKLWAYFRPSDISSQGKEPVKTFSPSEEDLPKDYVRAAGKRDAFASRPRMPSMVDVYAHGQCVAVLTSGGDSQGTVLKLPCLKAVNRVYYILLIILLFKTVVVLFKCYISWVILACRGLDQRARSEAPNVKRLHVSAS